MQPAELTVENAEMSTSLGAGFWTGWAAGMAATLGAFAGAVLGTAWGYRWGSLGAGMIGAVLGTIGGYAARTSLVAANGGRDRPVALGEDVLAVIAGVAVAYATSVL